MVPDTASRPSEMTHSGKIAEDLFRHEGSRIVAMLTNHLGVHRLQLAEDVVQEALIRAASSTHR